MNVWSTLGAVAGGAGGFFLGGPAGAVAGASAGAGIANHLSGAGKVDDDPALYDTDPDRLALGEYRRLSNPGYGSSQFARLAAGASTGAAAFTRGVQARGGSVAQGQALAAASSAQSQDRAFSAFGQFRLGADRAAQGALGMEAERARFQASGTADARNRNAERSASFTNQLIGSGLGLAGQQLGAGGFGGGQAPPAQPNTPYRPGPTGYNPSVLDLAAIYR